MALFVFAVSIFYLLVAPYEIFKTLQARSWTPVEVEVVTSELRRNHENMVLEVSVRDIQANQITGT